MSQAEPQKPYIGGQAVLEGVMMRAPGSLAIVLRRKDGRLHVRERAMDDGRTGVAKLPLVRGILSFVEALRLGQESLKFSLGAYEQDYLEEETAAADASHSASTHTTDDAVANSNSPKSGAARASSLSNVMKAFHVSLFTLLNTEGEATGGSKQAAKGGVSLIMMLPMVLLMVALPQIAATLATKLFKVDAPLQSPQFQALTGFFKLTIVLGYMLALRQTNHVKRMFQFHGAEHKTISTYEAGEELTVENARKKSTLHARCGTTFLVMVVLMSVVVFSVLAALLPTINTGHAWLDGVVFFFMKLPFLPIIAALTFELQRVFAKYFTKGPLRVVLLPGFLVQKITTIEPDDSQLEVALASLRVTLFRAAGAKTEAAASGAPDVFFEDYESLRTAPNL